MITNIPIEIVKIENEGYHLTIPGKINKVISTLIIDTGASKSVFDRRLCDIVKDDNIKAKSEDLHTTTLFSDEIPSVNGIINEIQIGTLYKYNFETTFIDLEHINKLYRDAMGKKIDGLIGNDLLVAHHAIIDYQGKTMRMTF